MNAKLLVISGRTTKRKVTLQLPAVLGRSREADITVAHPLISRRHCELSENNGLLMLRDLASLNGTMIGGRRIKSAALLPDTEFTVGPLTFRVLYEYVGELESVPDTRYVDETGGTTEAGHADVTSAGVTGEPMEALLAGPASASEVAMPDFMAMADADPEEAIPAMSASSNQASSAVPIDDSPWPPIANDKLPTVQLPDARHEPVEVDSSLQSGGHRRESPWAVEPPDVEELWHAPTASARPETPADVPAAEKVAEPPVKEKPPANPPKKPSYGEEIDPEFGSFLEGLQ